MGNDAVRLEIDSGIAIITLDRPEAGNALDAAMASQLGDACDRANHDDSIRLAVIRGAGNVFCRGRDSEERLGASELVASVVKPVVAAIGGDALGAGLELALACDIRIGADSARFGMPQLQSGRVPHEGGTQRLPRIVGRARALDLLFGGGTIDAAEAARIGLLSRVLPARLVWQETYELALKMADMAPYSLRFAKEAIVKGLDMTLDQGLRLEADLYFLMHTTHDRVEGITSYLQRRKPHFEGK
ncbi:MAG: enoyl-CoA hydratase/isomerase family protein [Chloroflexi bacterium]|nr:enoyl-CoA hydratase/isomerase family protein [Chloroflexota bacterium]